MDGFMILGLLSGSKQYQNSIKHQTIKRGGLCGLSGGWYDGCLRYRGSVGAGVGMHGVCMVWFRLHQVESGMNQDAVVEREDKEVKIQRYRYHINQEI